jgi:anti-sigma factor RsiW
MSCDTMHQRWDEYRDGSLSDEAREACENHLRRCPNCAATWDGETRWLAALGRDETIDGANEKAFATATVDRWKRTRRAGVIRKIGAWAAVAAAVAIGVTVFMTQRHDAPRQTNSAAVTAKKSDPAGELVQGLSRSIEKPANVGLAIRDTAAYLSLDRIVGMIDPVQQERFNRGAQ